MHRETAFELAASNIRFGAGVTREVGMDLADLGARRVLLVTDPTLSRMAPRADRPRIDRVRGPRLRRLRPRAG
jgi:hydroxyacid-oxoacid transhydrogenase